MAKTKVYNIRAWKNGQADQDEWYTSCHYYYAIILMLIIFKKNFEILESSCQPH